MRKIVVNNHLSLPADHSHENKHLGDRETVAQEILEVLFDPIFNFFQIDALQQLVRFSNVKVVLFSEEIHISVQFFVVELQFILDHCECIAIKRLLIEIRASLTLGSDFWL
jgi:hypothetical protein